MYLCVVICFFILIICFQSTLSQNEVSSTESASIWEVYEDIMKNVEDEWKQRMYMIKYGDELQYLYHMILVSSMVMNSYNPLKVKDVAEYMLLLAKFELVDKIYIEIWVQNINMTELSTFYELHQFRSKVQTIPAKWKEEIGDILMSQKYRRKCKYEILIQKFNEVCKRWIDDKYTLNLNGKLSDSDFYKFKRRQMGMRIILLLTVWSELDVFIGNKTNNKSM